jgi:hypothetical protein
MSKTDLVMLLAVCAFVIDRVVAALMFVTTLTGARNRQDAAGVTLYEEQLKKLLYFTVASVLGGIAIVQLPSMRLLASIDASSAQTHAVADALLTWLALVAGADRISSLVGDKGTVKTTKAPASRSDLKVVGTLQVDDAAAGSLRREAR